MKKNEKANDSKGKKAGSSCVNGSDTSMRISNDVSSQASHLYNESGYSSNTTSPCNVVQTAEFENPSDIWISPDFILDSSKVFHFVGKKEENLRLNS